MCQLCDDDAKYGHLGGESKMSDFATIQVKAYRVVNDWLNKTLLETRDFDEACEAKAEQEKLNQHDEIIVVAVIDA